MEKRIRRQKSERRKEKITLLNSRVFWLFDVKRINTWDYLELWVSLTIMILAILYFARPTDNPVIGANEPDLAFPVSRNCLSVSFARENAVGGKIFVRRRTLLIREWLLSWVEWPRLSNFAYRRGRNNANGRATETKLWNPRATGVYASTLRNPCERAERLNRATAKQQTNIRFNIFVRMVCCAFAAKWY